MHYQSCASGATIIIRDSGHVCIFVLELFIIVWNMNSDELTLLEDAVRKNSYDYRSFQKLLEILQSSSVDHFGNCALLPIRQVYFSNSVYSQKSWRNIDLFLFRGSYQIIFSGSHGLRMRLSILGKTLKR